VPGRSMDVLVVPGFARAGQGLARGVTVMPGLVHRSSRASVGVVWMLA